MATVKGANVTKYDAGGSGDNAIADGFIKTVEKVWIDSYVLSAVLATTSSILIARIPANKKVTDIVVHVPIMSDPGTNGTVYCCTGATVSKTTYFGTLILGGDTQKTTFDLGTVATVRLAATDTRKMQALGADTAIYLMIDTTVAHTVTGGTIRSIVRYT